METYSFSDDRLETKLERKDDLLTCQLTDRHTGRTWGPVPLMKLHVHTRGLQRTEIFDTYRIDRVEEVDNGVHITVGRSDHRLSLGLWVRLIDGELSVILSPAEIYERMSSYFMLFAVDILPGLMSVRENGQLLLPLGDGVSCCPGDKSAIDDRFLLYLEQERWELAPLLPACACHDDGGGLVALARECAADTECRVVTDGEGTGWCGFNFSLRRYYPDPVDMQRREIRFSPISGEDDPVMSTAARLRRHVIEDHDKPTLRERCEESDGLAYLLDAYKMKLFHGIENEGPICEGWDKSGPISFRNCMTFAEAENCLERLHDAGIDKIHTASVGWNARGHDGMYPTRFPVEERLGGEEGFRELIQRGKELGYQMNVHDNFVMNVPHAPDWNPEYIVHDVHGNPMVSGWWAGGVEYQTWGLALPQQRFDDHFRRMKDLGVSGTYYVDYMLRPPEVNYHPRHKGPRSDSVLGQVRIHKETRKAFGSVATEFGTFPAAVACDYVTSVGHRLGGTDYPIKNLIDENVPLWDLTFHGLTARERHGGPSWDIVLGLVLFGRHPRDEWSVRERPMPVLTDERIARQKAVYELSLKRFGHLQFAEITDWKRTDEVEEVTYETGETVAVDWGTKDLYVDGDKVSRPEVLR